MPNIGFEHRQKKERKLRRMIKARVPTIVEYRIPIFHKATLVFQMFTHLENKFAHLLSYSWLLILFFIPSISGCLHPQKLFEEKIANVSFVTPKGGQIKFRNVRLIIPPGALEHSVEIKIQPLTQEELPPLPPGMMNVTKGASGYQFLPAGTQFSKPIQISIPIDTKSKAGSLWPALEVRTYFWDKALKRWKPLPYKKSISKIAVKKASLEKRIESETTHFTIMINAVLKSPDKPGPSNFNANSIKDLASVAPTTEVDLIWLPQINNKGDAQLTYPFKLPKGRGSFSPSLELNYSSSGGNGMVGIGWNLSVRKIEIDTRWGVPKYDGSEKYLLEGASIIPVPLDGARCISGNLEKKFEARIRTFQEILYCTNGNESHWQVTGKDGIRFEYGFYPDSSLGSKFSDEEDHVGIWFLSRVTDPNGNISEYHYSDNPSGLPDPQNSEGEAGNQKYLKEILYTSHASYPSESAHLDNTYKVNLEWNCVDREDVNSSARLGFKVKTECRLDSLQIFSRDLTNPDNFELFIRSYQLEYSHSFLAHKSLLKEIIAYGNDGSFFYKHVLEYTQPEFMERGDSEHIFAETTNYPTIPANQSGLSNPDRRLNQTSEKNYQIGAGFGVTVSAGGSGCGFGVSVDASLEFPKPKLLIRDMNGDGISDRVWIWDGNIGVVLGHQSESGNPKYGADDAGNLYPTDLPGLSSVGHEGAAEMGVGANGSCGVTFGGRISLRLAAAESLLMDADSDGFTDLIFKNSYLKGLPRSCRTGNSDWIDPNSPDNPPFKKCEDDGLVICPSRNILCFSTDSLNNHLPPPPSDSSASLFLDKNQRMVFRSKEERSHSKEKNSEIKPWSKSLRFENSSKLASLEKEDPTIKSDAIEDYSSQKYFPGPVLTETSSSQAFDSNLKITSSMLSEVAQLPDPAPMVEENPELLEEKNWGPYTSGIRRLAKEEDIIKRLYRLNPVIRWDAPHKGRIHFSTQVKKKYRGGSDGLEIKIFKVVDYRRSSGSQLIKTIKINPGDVDWKVIKENNVSIGFGESLVWVVDPLVNVPMAVNGTSLDAVDLNVRVVYGEVCRPGLPCRMLTSEDANHNGPTGQRDYIFELKKDFRISELPKERFWTVLPPLGPPQLNNGGELIPNRITGIIKKLERTETPVHVRIRCESVESLSGSDHRTCPLGTILAEHKFDPEAIGEQAFSVDIPEPFLKNEIQEVIDFEEDCIAYEQQSLQIIEDPLDLGWIVSALMKGRDIRFVFGRLDTHQDALQFLQLALNHEEHCMIGRLETGRPRGEFKYVHDYWKGGKGDFSPSPDLIVDVLNHFPINPTVQDQITIIAQVRNIGPGASQRSFLSLKVGGITTPEVFEIPPLNSGEFFEVQHRVPLNIARDYRNTAIIDFDNRINESREDNNETLDNYRVVEANQGSPVPGVPDLVIDRFTHSPISPTEQDQITFVARVRNIGSGRSPISYLNFKIGGETFGENYEIPPLNPGYFFEVRRQSNLTVVQNYRNTAIIDFDNRIDESKEDNNESHDNYRVVEKSQQYPDCIGYAPNLLQVEKIGSQEWVLKSGPLKMLVFDSEEDANNMLKIAKKYTKQCFIGRNNTRQWDPKVEEIGADRYAYIRNYWAGGMGDVFDPIRLLFEIDGENGSEVDPNAVRWEPMLNIVSVRDLEEITSEAGKKILVGRKTHVFDSHKPFTSRFAPLYRVHPIRELIPFKIKKSGNGIASKLFIHAEAVHPKHPLIVTLLNENQDQEVARFTIRPEELANHSQNTLKKTRVFENLPAGVYFIRGYTEVSYDLRTRIKLWAEIFQETPTNYYFVTKDNPKRDFEFSQYEDFNRSGLKIAVIKSSRGEQIGRSNFPEASLSVIEKKAGPIFSSGSLPRIDLLSGTTSEDFVEFTFQQGNNNVKKIVKFELIPQILVNLFFVDAALIELDSPPSLPLLPSPFSNGGEFLCCPREEFSQPMPIILVEKKEVPVNLLKANLGKGFLNATEMETLNEGENYVYKGGFESPKLVGEIAHSFEAFSGGHHGFFYGFFNGEKKLECIGPFPCLAESDNRTTLSQDTGASSGTPVPPRKLKTRLLSQKKNLTKDIPKAVDEISEESDHPKVTPIVYSKAEGNPRIPLVNEIRMAYAKELLIPMKSLNQIDLDTADILSNRTDDCIIKEIYSGHYLVTLFPFKLIDNSNPSYEDFNISEITIAVIENSEAEKIATKVTPQAKLLKIRKDVPITGVRFWITPLKNDVAELKYVSFGVGGTPSLKTLTVPYDQITYILVRLGFVDAAFVKISGTPVLPPLPSPLTWRNQDILCCKVSSLKEIVLKAKQRWSDNCKINDPKGVDTFTTVPVESYHEGSDMDSDGVPDSSDFCPFIVGDRGNGCPESFATPVEDVCSPEDEACIIDEVATRFDPPSSDSDTNCMQSGTYGVAICSDSVVPGRATQNPGNGRRGGGSGDSGDSGDGGGGMAFIDGIQRTWTLGLSGHGGVGMGPFSVQLSANLGAEYRDRNVMDWNGDGLPDFQSPNIIKLAGRNHSVELDVSCYFPQELAGLIPGVGEEIGNAMSGVSAALTGSECLIYPGVNESFSFGIGFNIQFGASFQKTFSHKTTSNGKTKFDGQVGATLGVGMNTSSSFPRLMRLDINGDGLPDIMSASDENKSKFQLNLGYRLGKQEPEINLTKNISNATNNIGAKILNWVGNFLPFSSSLSGSDSFTRSFSVGGSFDVDFGIAGAGGSFTRTDSTTTSLTNRDFYDFNGDGLIDVAQKYPDLPGIYVSFNTGDRFLDPIPGGFANQRWNTSLDYPHFDQLSHPIVEELTQSGIDALSVSGSDMTSWSGEVRVKVLIFSGSVSYSQTEGSSNVKMVLMDVTGDGLPDRVYREGFEPGGTVQVQKNLLGGANLLKTVHRPFGGKIELSYKQTIPSEDDPSARWILQRATLDHEDDFPEEAKTAPMTLQFEYENPYFDRYEKEFFGFKTAKTTRADGRVSEQVFENRNYWLQGEILFERIWKQNEGAPDDLFLEVATTYEPARFIPSSNSPRSDCLSHLILPLRRLKNQTTEAAGTTPCDIWYPKVKKIVTREFEGGVSASPHLTRSQIFEEYDSYGNPTKVREEFESDSQHNITVAIDYDHKSCLTDAHILDRANSIEVHGGNVVTGPLLRKRAGAFNCQGNLTHHEAWADSTGNKKSSLDLTYDGAGFVDSITDANGYKIDFTPDDYSHQFTVRTEDNFNLFSTTEYDHSLQQITALVDVNGNRQERELDTFGRIEKVWGPFELNFKNERNIPSISVTYSDLRPESQIYPAYADSVNSAVYPTDGSLLTQIKIRRFIDGHARDIQTQALTEVNGQRGRVASGKIEFDGAGRRVKLGQPEFFEDGIFSSDYDYENIPLNDALSSVWTYDVLNRNLTQTLPGARTTEWEYGISHHPETALASIPTREIKITDPENKIKFLHQDSKQQLVAVKEVLDGIDLLTSYGYQPAGELASIKDANQNVRTYEYDLIGQKTAIQTPDTGRLEFAYDSMGNVIEQVDQELCSDPPPLLGDPAHCQNRIIKWEYDKNRLVRIDYPDSPDIIFAYGDAYPNNLCDGLENTKGRVCWIQDSAGTEKISYDSLGQVIQSHRGITPFGTPTSTPSVYQTSFQYDSFGRLLEVLYPDGEQVAYGYDAGGNVNTVSGERNDSPTLQYILQRHYDKYGKPLSTAFGNGVTETNEYDPVTQRLHIRSVSRGDTLISSLELSNIDKAGNIKASSSLRGEGHLISQVSRTYTYDDLHRLETFTLNANDVTSAQNLSISGNYAYNKVGNITLQQLNHSGIGTSLTRNWNYEYNHPTRPNLPPAIGPFSFTYNNRGATKTYTRPGAVAGNSETTTYTWDEEDRLTQVQAPNSQSNYRYDSNGSRVLKNTIETSPAGETVSENYYYPSPYYTVWEKQVRPSGCNDSSCEVGASHRTKQVRVDGQTIAAVSGIVDPGSGTTELSISYLSSSSQYLHTDQVQSTSVITGAGGLGEHIFEYLPYGEIVEPLSSDVESLKLVPGFNGMEQDLNTGLNYFGKRYYYPKFGRWLTADKYFMNQPEELVEFAKSNVLYQNLYTFSLNNPARYRDVDGDIPLETIADIVDVGASAYDLYKEPSWLNAGMLLWSAAAVALPYVPGSYVAKAGRRGTALLKRGDDVGDAAKRVDKASDAGKRADDAGDTSKALKKCSFAAGTLVLTKNGFKPIEDIRAGDEVLAQDENGTELAWKVVTLAYNSLHDDAMGLVVENLKTGEQEKLITTSEHPFHVSGQGWKRADALSAGDHITTADRDDLRVVSVTLLQQRQLAYNMEVADFHTYFVGHTQLWVHNGCNWKSVKQFGHTFSRHGAGAKNTKKLKGRAAATRKPQGQFLDNEGAAKFLDKFSDIKKPTEVDLPSGMGQVIKPDGSIVPANKILIIPNKAGGIKTAFPKE